MEAIHELLADVGGTNFAQRCRLDGERHFVVTVDDEVIVTLSMSDDDEYCLFSHSPGLMQDAAVDWDEQGVWFNDVPDDEVPGARDRLILERNSGWVTLQRCLPRALMHRVQLQRELERCVSVHRHWSNLLAPVQADSSGLA